MTTPNLRRPRSLFSLERMRSDRRVTWLTIAGLILVPLVIGGLLVWALWNPTERLGDVKAAVVNLDKPVTLNGQTVPLGRQLSAGLLDGHQDNFSWVLTDQKDAAKGVADGGYVAVVTIPENFSKAATSTAGSAADATKATIDVRTSQKSKLVDPAISQAVTTTATSVLNKQLTSTYLKNVYVGFNTLHDQIGQAADGASTLSDGLGRLSSGTQQLATGATQLASGADQLSSGLGQLSSGASRLSDGLGTLSSGTSQLAGGLGTLEQGTASLPDATSGLSTGVGLAAQSAKAALQACATAHGMTDLACQAIAQTYGIMTTAQNGRPSLVDGAKELAASTPALTGGIAQAASAAQQLAAGAAQSASGGSQLAEGVQQSADGAAQYATGAHRFADGVPALASGAAQSASGAASLASGLNTAVAQLPSYDAGERTNLASVAAEPVTQKSSGNTAFGTSSIPLFASVALWLGALAAFLVLQAISRRALLTARAAGLVALDGLVPAAALGAVQGVLVAGVMQPALQLGVGAWFAFAGVAVGVGVAFAAVNHGLVALLGGVGRFLSMLVIVVTLAAGIVSTAPGFFDALLPWLPTAPAITALQGAIDGTTGVWRGLGGLLVWAAFGFGLALLGIARRRVVTAAQLLPAE